MNSSTNVRKDPRRMRTLVGDFKWFRGHARGGLSPEEQLTPGAPPLANLFQTSLCHAGGVIASRLACQDVITRAYAGLSFLSPPNVKEL
ncbi:unnamed protein product [Caenorhabditis auriculariae]|uniref:Uncharacterized protein n=1 Tax=Caenorhabditis auriculariae TaxID=2777116 RepID=A0A8S1HBJ9_9PELO|nr:unnamed protein product [Caenorhabditis auriculariae]